MNNIIRAWKNEVYRQSLSVEEQAMLPANPAGEIELTEAELEAIFGTLGGFYPHPVETINPTAVQNGYNTFRPVSIKVPPTSLSTTSGITGLTAVLTGVPPVVSQTASGDNACAGNSQSPTSNPWDLD